MRVGILRFCWAHIRFTLSITCCRVSVCVTEARCRGNRLPGGSKISPESFRIEDCQDRRQHRPPLSVSSISPLSRAISSVPGRGLGRSPTEGIFLRRSRSRLPIDTVHLFSLDDRRVPSLSSGPWYGRMRRRLRDGAFGASGGGVGGRL